MTTRPRAQQADDTAPDPQQVIAALQQEVAQQNHVTRSLSQRIANMAIEIADRDAVIAQQWSQNAQLQKASQKAAQADPAAD